MFVVRKVKPPPVSNLAIGHVGAYVYSSINITWEYEHDVYEFAINVEFLPEGIFNTGTSYNLPWQYGDRYYLKERKVSMLHYVFITLVRHLPPLTGHTAAYVWL